MPRGEVVAYLLQTLPKSALPKKNSLRKLSHLLGLYNAVELYFKSTSSADPLLNNILLSVAKCVTSCEKQTQQNREAAEKLTATVEVIRAGQKPTESDVKGHSLGSWRVCRKFGAGPACL